MSITRTPFNRGSLARRLVALALVGASIGAFLPTGAASAAGAQDVTGRISGEADFTDANGGAGKVVTAGDGRFVAFTSAASDLVPGTQRVNDRVYVRDLLTDEVELVSGAYDGNNEDTARVGAITPDGRFVVFVANGHLVQADTNPYFDVYLRDRALGTTELISVSSNGANGTSQSGGFNNEAAIDISDDGRMVVFESSAANLVAGDGNGVSDVFWRDRATNTTVLVSQANGVPGNGASTWPTMSADGLTVAFATEANNLFANDTNDASDILLRRMDGVGALTRISVGLDGNPDGPSEQPAMSADGAKVAFVSPAADLVANDTNGANDVFVRHWVNATTSRVSLGATGAQLPEGANDPAISPNGDRVAFVTQTRVLASDGDGARDVYVRIGSAILHASRNSGGADGDINAFHPAVSDRTTVFLTQAKLVDTDLSYLADAYVRRSPLVSPHDSFESFHTTVQQRITGSASPASVAAGAAAIRRGASPQHQVIDLLDGSGFAAKRSPVVRLYWAYFRRRPDLGGLNYWIDQHASGRKTLHRISLEFAKSNEFRTTYGNTTSTQFVTLVYRNVLEREPEAGGLAYWARRIDQGASRGRVMTSFSESEEGKQVMSAYVDSVVVGLGLIGKIPSQQLFNAGVASSRHGGPREAFVDLVLEAPEYAATL